MHSLVKEPNGWTVFRSDQADGSTFLTPLFNRLSFDTAMKLVNFLNGGGAQFSPELTKVIEMCKV